MIGGIRKIIHVDMDAFYASVEQRDDPTLRGKPLIVGGKPETRGVVASCSYEARKYGIRSAMSTRRALALCPSALIVRPNMSKYKEVSDKIRSIFFDVTDLVEPLSLDEAYLDVTTNKLSEPYARELARLIRSRIKSQLGLTASAGVGPNKFIAKCASDLRKPDALVVIPPEQVNAFVEKLPVEKLWGVGPATARKLHDLGLRTAQDIRDYPRDNLVQSMGKFGVFLFELAHGRDDREVSAIRKRKSAGSETTFDQDTLDLALLEATLDELTTDLAEYLREKDGLARTITLKVRYSNFETITRSRTLDQFISDEESILNVAKELLRSKTNAGKTPIRLIGVSVHNFFDPDSSSQMTLEF